MTSIRLALVGALAAPAAALLLAGCAHTPPGPSVTRAEGMAFAYRACAGCHAFGARTASPNPQAPTFAELNDRFPGWQLEVALHGVAQRGHIAMPPIYMTDEEIQAVAAYIRSSGAKVAQSRPARASARAA